VRFRDLLIRNVASPYGIAVASFLVFCVAFVFPPGLYSSYLKERDLMFLDSASFVFFLMCTLGFLLGLFLIDFLAPVHGFKYEKRETRISPLLFILLPVVAGTATVVLSIVILLRNNAFLLALVLSGQGVLMHSEVGIQVEGTLVQACPAVMGIVWWALWRKDQFSFRGWRRFAVHFGISVAVLSLLVLESLKLTRGEMMPVIAGVAVVLLLRRLVEGKLTLVSFLRFAAFFAISIVGTFTAVSALRGVADRGTLVSNVLGYTVAPYNRMAAVLDGRIYYPFSGRGYYISTFASYNHTFNRIFHANEIFGWPDVDADQRSQFNAVAAAGLNGDLIWPGAFGYIFSELKWLSPLLLIIYGLLTGWMWRLLRLGKTTGILLYPWCAFCILFWFGVNYLLDTQPVVLLIDAIGLVLYETLFIRHPRKNLLET
jgi:hypothetical protein